jgi:hypothetical protein
MVVGPFRSGNSETPIPGLLTSTSAPTIPRPSSPGVTGSRNSAAPHLPGYTNNSHIIQTHSNYSGKDLHNNGNTNHHQNIQGNFHAHTKVFSTYNQSSNSEIVSSSNSNSNSNNNNNNNGGAINRPGAINSLHLSNSSDNIAVVQLNNKENSTEKSVKSPPLKTEHKHHHNKHDNNNIKNSSSGKNVPGNFPNVPENSNNRISPGLPGSGPGIFHSGSSHVTENLCDAIKNNNLMEVDLILKNCAKNDLENSVENSPEGDKPLHVAVKAGNADILRLLLATHEKMGVDYNIVNAIG